METKEKNKEAEQLIKEITPKTEKEIKETKVKEPQKISISYTLKAFGNNITKMKNAKLITEIEHQQLKEIHSTMIQRWISIGMEI